MSIYNEPSSLPAVSISVGNPDICTNMLIDRTFDDSGSVVNIPFRGKDSILTLFNYDPDMIVLVVVKNTIVENNVPDSGKKMSSGV